MKRLAVVLALVLCGCDEAALAPVPDAGAEPVAGLSAEQAGKVLAVVGGKPITLGDYARVLQRLPEGERARYQTKERRRELLTGMIELELLSQEARKRGLDQKPQVRAAIVQLYRDQLLGRLRDQMPPPASITAAEVQAYYDAHADRYTQPERRRVAAIVTAKKADAEAALKAAKEAKNATEWGAAFAKYSLNAPGSKAKSPADPVELLGDLGMVGPPSDPRGGNIRVPEAVRQAVFQIDGAGKINDAIVEVEGKFFVVRLLGVTPGHTQTRAEADKSIRVAILQEKLEQAEKALEAELRAKFKVEINEDALSKLKLPAALVDAATAPSPWSKPDPSASSSAASASPTSSASAPPAPTSRPDGGP